MLYFIFCLLSIIMLNQLSSLHWCLHTKGLQSSTLAYPIGNVRL